MSSLERPLPRPATHTPCLSPHSLVLPFPRHPLYIFCRVGGMQGGGASLAADFGSRFGASAFLHAFEIRPRPQSPAMGTAVAATTATTTAPTSPPANGKRVAVQVVVAAAVAVAVVAAARTRRPGCSPAPAATGPASRRSWGTRGRPARTTTRTMRSPLCTGPARPGCVRVRGGGGGQGVARLAGVAPGPPAGTRPADPYCYGQPPFPAGCVRTHLRPRARRVGPSCHPNCYPLCHLCAVVRQARGAQPQQQQQQW